MKTTKLFFLLGIAIAFGSCTTAYKTGQTPDDVYSSPAPPESEYVKTNRNDDRRYRQYEDEYSDYQDYDDRYLRMKVRNRALWSDLDDWYYYGNRYNFSYYNNWNYWNDPFYWNNPWSPVSYWNTYYNPYWSNWGWGGWYGGYYGWGGGWYGSYWDPWYSPWYGGYYGGYGGYYGWGGGWYGSYWDPYIYGPGYWTSGIKAAYGPRTTNLRTYDPSVLGRNSSLSSNAGYRSTYGVRGENSVNTNQSNSSSSTRGATLRGRFGGNSNQTYNRSVEPSGRSSNIGSSPSYSSPSSSGSSGGSSGGRSSGGGGSAPSRRF